jgi:hypothetical protein
MGGPLNLQEVDSAAEDFVLADPVLRLIYTGRAKTLDEAEELYLDESMPEIMRLLASSMSDSELQAHPLMQLLYSRRMTGMEDSLI